MTFSAPGKVAVLVNLPYPAKGQQVPAAFLFTLFSQRQCGAELSFLCPLGQVYTPLSPQVTDTFFSIWAEPLKATAALLTAPRPPWYHVDWATSLWRGPVRMPWAVLCR